MTVSDSELEQSGEAPSGVYDALCELERRGAFKGSALLDTLEHFWEIGEREAAAFYFKKFFWRVWFLMGNPRMQQWHDRFCEMGRIYETPFLAGSMLPFLGSNIRFSLAQLTSFSIGADATRLCDLATRLGSSDPNVMRDALIQSNDERNNFDALTGYSVGSSEFFPSTDSIGEIVYDSGLDDFDDSMSVEVIPYYRESAMLETRLAAHDGKFDSILLVEGATDYQGKPKPSYFMEVFDDEFRRRNRIRNIVVDFPKTTDPWVRERLQRDTAVSLLAPLHKDALIFSSDLDELFDVNQMASYLQICSNGPVSVTSIPFTHCIANMSDNLWLHPKMFLRKYLPESLSALRLIAERVGPIAGWHLTYFGDEKFIADKLKAFAHTEIEPNPNIVLDAVGVAEQNPRVGDVIMSLPTAVKDRWSKCTLHEECASLS